MEIAICIFLGAWIAIAGALAYKWLSNEYGPYLNDEGKSNELSER